MEAAGGELGAVLSPTVGQAVWAELFGVRVLRADDAHGHGHGMVTQHDEIRWVDLLELAVFAAPACQALQHPRPTCVRAVSGGAVARPDPQHLDGERVDPGSGRRRPLGARR